MKSIFYKIKNFFLRIETLIYWFPVIWNDCDWDYIFLLKTLRHKLASMQKFFNSKHAWTENAKDKAKEIGELIGYIDNILDQSHFKEGMKKFQQAFPEYDWEHGFENSFVPCDDFPGCHEYKSDMTEEQDAYFKACCEHADKMEDNDYLRLFDILKLKIRTFWD